MAEMPDHLGEASGGTAYGPEDERQARPAQNGAAGDEAPRLMEEVLRRENLLAAHARVVANGGAPGIDGMTVEALEAYCREHWPRIREELLGGHYQPQPVRRVEIPKPGGGVRMLGIPTVLDRMIQQALLQVLTPLFDPTFSADSYGFRPGRSAHQAVERAREHIAGGYRWVVDLDLAKFFDTVNHDVLMHRVAPRVRDKRVLRLIGRYLRAGVLEGGLVSPRTEGTPQGGPLSPLLSNILLDDLDQELERRGHRFVRYADDCNVYVRSLKAGARVMAWLRRLYARLRLTVNETKSAVASAVGRKFLGYSLWVAKGGEIKRRVADKPLATFKQRVRQLTRRSGGRSLAETAARLRPYLLGWKAYFRLAQTPRVWRELDEWLRHRLRAIQLKHWKRGTTMYRELKALGASDADAHRVAANSRSGWRNSAGQLNRVLTIACFDRWGVPRLS